MKILKKIIIYGLIFLGISVLFVWWANKTIEDFSSPYVSNDISKIPSEKAAMLLGTSKKLDNGNINLYFKYRIDATAQLYKSGKIKAIIVSGDNSVKGYNETKDMKQDLIALGIPENVIYEDFAGFRTLDSVVRTKSIFGQNKIIFVSQKFHNERAVYLARKNGIEAYGYNAKDVNKYAGFKTKVREYFARVKVFVDFLLGVEPKFGGEKVEVK